MRLFCIEDRRVWRVGGGMVHDRPKGQVLGRARLWLDEHGIAYVLERGMRQECVMPALCGPAGFYRHVQYNDVVVIADDTAAVLFRLAFPEARPIECDETVRDPHQ